VQHIGDRGIHVGSHAQFGTLAGQVSHGTWVGERRGVHTSKERRWLSGGGGRCLDFQSEARSDMLVEIVRDVRREAIVAAVEAKRTVGFISAQAAAAQADESNEGVVEGVADARVSSAREAAAADAVFDTMTRDCWGVSHLFLKRAELSNIVREATGVIGKFELVQGARVSAIKAGKVS